MKDIKMTDFPQSGRPECIRNVYTLLKTVTRRFDIRVILLVSFESPSPIMREWNISGDAKNRCCLAPVITEYGENLFRLGVTSNYFVWWPYDEEQLCIGGEFGIGVTS